MSDDGTSITLKLREGVKFHSGREFTADDVIFTIQAMQREDVSSQLKHVALAIDDMTGRRRPHGDAAPVPPGLEPVRHVRGDADRRPGHLRRPAGRQADHRHRPFQGGQLHPWLGRQARAQRRLLGGRPPLPRRRRHRGPEPVDLDAAPPSSRGTASSRSTWLRSMRVSLADDPQFDVIESDADDSDYYVASNVSIPPLDQPEVRQGIAWAIDRDRVLDQALGGSVRPARCRGRPRPRRTTRRRRRRTRTTWTRPRS